MEIKKTVTDRMSRGKLDMDKKNISQIKQGKTLNSHAKTVKNKNQHDQLPYIADLFDHVNDAVVASDAEYRLIAWNAAAETMYGWKAGEVLGKNGLDIVQTVFPEVDKNQMLKSIAETGKYRGEATQIRKDGMRFPVDVSSIVLRDKRGKITGYVSVNRDITARKQMEEKLRESNERLQWAMEATQDGVWDWDVPTAKAYYSPAYFTMLGYPPNNKLPTHINTWIELIHPDDRQKALSVNADCAENRCERFEVEFRMLAQDGTWRWILSMGKAVRRDAQGMALRMVGTHTDITERRRAEEEFRESEEKHRTFIEQSSDGLTLVNEQGNIIEWNYAREVLTGLKHEDVLGKPYWDVRFKLSPPNLQTPDVLQRFKSTALSMIQTGQSPLFNKIHQGELVTASGELKTIEQIAFPIKTKQGYCIGSVTRDITERKHAEEALLKSEEQFRSLVEQSIEGIILIDEQGCIIEWNTAEARITGITKDSAIGAPFWEIQYQLLKPESRARISLEYMKKTFFELIQSGRSEQLRKAMEIEIISATGDRKFIQQTSFIIKTEKGNWVAAVVNDITERKRAEEAQQESEGRYRTLVEYSPDAIGIHCEGRIVYVNDAGIKLFHANRAEDLIGYPVIQLVHPDYRAIVIDRMRRSYENHLSSSALEEKFITLDGISIDVEVISTPIIYQGKSASQIIVRNITGRKQAADALRESETKLKSIFENSQDAIGVSHKGVHVLVNPAYVSMFGCENAEEIVGLPVLDLIAPESRATVSEYAHARVRGENAPAEYEAVALRKDGSTFIMNVHASTYCLNDEQYTVAIMRDITERKRAEEQIQEQLKYLRSLHIIDSAINSSFSLEETLKILVEQVVSDLKADAVSVLLFNKQNLILEYAASQGFHSNALKFSNLQLGQGYAGQSVLERRTIHVPDLTRESSALSQSLLLAKERFVAYYGVPLFARDEIVGVLEIFHRSPLTPTQEWENFLNTLAGQAAIAIDNAQLFDNLQRSNLDLTLAYDATIEGWSHALDLRDKETEGHAQRVASLTVKLAEQMGIPDAEIVHIRRGALLHDIGKMGVPDEILFKPGPLNEQEMETMRRHPSYAHKMLSSIDYLKDALIIPRYHHEKWDGTGYPHKLKGEEIPVAARIFAVVDVWDALTSDRPYRAAWTKEKAVEHIKSDAGKHFDPKIAVTFLTLISRE